ncbi:MAG: tRNA pseudouridine(38-40) synthase TruA [Aquabacterium sp.]|uniref:tRNA pseudouridine(38-40) synthase TruA n=1 Tax=Aquabacterium sp. TaxID=1872578 RepID=UPI001206BDF8|nr:tRNA pseudouridine(38-40) synthase TruA [Aquabacterium sp.]TAK84387.1 MAG: tRNA pseudouridine(38-40) synthase TruA [Aquabacterium sp.]
MQDDSPGLTAPAAFAPADQNGSDLTGATRRVALGVSYLGCAYKGWQSQPGGGTVQDALEAALSEFATKRIKVMCAGRTDAGVHGINQVVHLDTDIDRAPFSWVRGTNAYLPKDIAVQWAAEVPAHFHARNSALGRRYTYVLLEAAVRPALETGRAGWVFRPLDLDAMLEAAQHLIGEHDFSSFRSSMCQSPTPVKELREIRIRRCGPPHAPTAYWRFDFEGKAFLHHMIRNIMGCLIMVGTGVQPASWVLEVLHARDRKVAAPTFSPDGLYFFGPRYDPAFGLPEQIPGQDWLPT